MAADEGNGGASEQVREQAREKPSGAAAGQTLQQIRHEEGKAKRRDDGVAQAIMQFLTDAQRRHLSVLIARLVALNCPSSLILAILSLINEDCLTSVTELLKDALQKTEAEEVAAHANLIPSMHLDRENNRLLVDWITRIEMVLHLDSSAVLTALVTPDEDIDGTILQLTTFVLQEFFGNAGKSIPFEKLHPLAASILQSIFEPYFATSNSRDALPSNAEEV